MNCHFSDELHSYQEDRTLNRFLQAQLIRNGPKSFWYSSIVFFAGLISLGLIIYNRKPTRIRIESADRPHAGQDQRIAAKTAGSTNIHDTSGAMVIENRSRSHVSR